MRVTLAPSGANSIEARIGTPTHEYDIVTESNYALDPTMIPWLPPTMTAAMRSGWDLDLDGPVDAIATAGAGRAQQVITGWYPHRYTTIAISGTGDAPVRDEQRGVGCFFSGGVDSFYSAITQLDRITHLIFVLGFDIAVDNTELAEQALTAARDAAKDLGKPLIEVTTTVRSAFGEILGVPWGYLFHGPCLAHVGLALSPHLSTVIIPSSNIREQMEPWGTHPDLDPLWSSGAVAFEHDGLEADRFAKIRRISDSEPAMNHLRVCWQNRNSSYNCGECYKCIRTQVGLKIAGGRCATLPDEIDPAKARQISVTRPLERERLRAWIPAMREVGIHDENLEKAFKSAIRQSYVREAFVRSQMTVGKLVNRLRP